MSLNQTLRDLHAAFPDSDQKMPVLFVGHGNPMNALEDNEICRCYMSCRCKRKMNRSGSLLMG